MGKLLFWLVIVLLVLSAARIVGRLAAARQDRPPGAQPRGASRPPAERAPETMVCCARCGIHLPRSEAIAQGGKIWCSQEHARLGSAAQ